jgi:hypothetical protein
MRRRLEVQAGIFQGFFRPSVRMSLTAYFAECGQTFESSIVVVPAEIPLLLKLLNLMRSRSKKICAPEWRG